MLRDMTEPGKATKATSGVHFPPPFLYVGFLLLGLLLERWAPLVRLPRIPSRTLAAVLLFAGLGLLLWCLLLFLRARTSPLPFRPSAALVASGAYRWTRNPMYLAMLLVYLGAALLFDLFWALLLAPVVVLLMNRLVIAKEERYLDARFGDEYRRYRARVRRWI
jgi:protein-S-isoprenylcysteine O-methyltransferase Ste14